MQVHVLKQSKFCIHTCMCTQIPPNKHFTKTFLSEKNPNSRIQSCTHYVEFLKAIVIVNLHEDAPIMAGSPPFFLGL